MSITLVGILNVTPDSFSDGGNFLDARLAVAQAEQLFADGARVVDIGGEATNPWAASISAAEEWRRLEPIVRAVLPGRPDYSFSIDTRHPEIVEKAAQYGKFYVNDVTTFINPQMVTVTAKHGLRAIVSHLPLEAHGDIALAHQSLKIDDTTQVRNELLAQQSILIAAGIGRDDIVLDPGIGFGKSMRLNWKLLEFAKLVPGAPVMIGFSRKRFLTTDPQTSETVEGLDKADPELNLRAANIAAASSNGELLLRVHEPKLYQNL